MIKNFNIKLRIICVAAKNDANKICNSFNVCVCAKWMQKCISILIEFPSASSFQTGNFTSSKHKVNGNKFDCTFGRSVKYFSQFVRNEYDFVRFSLLHRCALLHISM